MRKVFFVVFLMALCGFAAFSQAPAAASGPASEPAAAKRGPIFRATKAQIKDVQTMLRNKKLYTGESTGKLDPDTRSSIKSYQKGHGLKETGTLNRATLEKMGIELTDTQKAIPVSPNSFATEHPEGHDMKTSDSKMSDAKTAGSDDKPKRTIFRATKDQIMEAQSMLRAKGMYSGEATGKLDDATREGLKKFQTANGVKATGTLNQVTLEKMGIELTDKQKAADTDK